ncbi:hypothetical protein VTO42DRAFT_4805 [Malbranchea cinnamomea]
MIMMLSDRRRACGKQTVQTSTTDDQTKHTVQTVHFGISRGNCLTEKHRPTHHANTPNFPKLNFCHRLARARASLRRIISIVDDPLCTDFSKSAAVFSTLRMTVKVPDAPK